MDFKRKASYGNVHRAYPSMVEMFEAPVTLPYNQWVQYVATGQNTLYDGAIVPGGTEENGAVYTGHVRQNPFTAGGNTPF